MRQKPEINELDDDVKLKGKQILFDAYEKWCKIYKHSRKKEFKFSNLVSFLESKNTSEAEK
jgi:hypothetical protein